MWSSHVSTSTSSKQTKRMPLATKVAGFAAFGVLARAYALGIQRRHPFERVLSPVSPHFWRHSLTEYSVFIPFRHNKVHSLTLAAQRSLVLWAMLCTGQNRGRGISLRRNIVRLLRSGRHFELCRPRQSQNRVRQDFYIMVLVL